jgi:hypothetical protein
MRHFLFSRSVTTLALGMGTAATTTRLIALTRRTQ